MFERMSRLVVCVSKINVNCDKQKLSRLFCHINLSIASRNLFARISIFKLSASHVSFSLCVRFVMCEKTTRQDNKTD